MQKFLSIPITATGETNQFIPVSNVGLVQQASTTTTTITYQAAGAAASDVITITHTAMATNDVTFRDLIKDSIIAALQTSWTNPLFEVSLSGLVSAAPGPVTVTAVTIA